MRSTAIAVFVLFALGCEAYPEVPSVEVGASASTSFRCALGRIPALGGLDRVEMSGNARVLGYGSQFDVFSNEDITLSGKARIDGRAYSADGRVIVASNARVMGGILLGGPTVPPHVPYELADEYESDNDNDSVGRTSRNRRPLPNKGKQVFSLYGSDSKQLPDARYAFEGLTISGKSTLSLEAATTTIFVNGAIAISGGSSLGTGTATRLLIVSTSTQPITITGGSSVIGRIYAPLAPIVVSGNSEVEGAMVGASLSTSGSSRVEVTQDALSIWDPC